MLALAGCDRLTISPGLLEQMEASTDEVREGGEGGGARKRGGGGREETESGGDAGLCCLARLASLGCRRSLARRATGFTPLP